MNERPTIKQIAYAISLGITVTPDVTRTKLSALISAAKLKQENPELAHYLHFWNALIDNETNIVLVAYRKRGQTIVDVLEIIDANVTDMAKQRVRVEAMSPKRVKDPYIGDQLEWEKRVKFYADEVTHSEIVGAEFPSIPEYETLIKRGLAAAKTQTLQNPTTQPKPNESRTLSQNCDTCGAQLRYPADQAGSSVKCRQCGEQLRLRKPTPALDSNPATPQSPPMPSWFPFAFLAVLCLPVLMCMGICSGISSAPKPQRAAAVPANSEPHPAPSATNPGNSTTVRTHSVEPRHTDKAVLVAYANATDLLAAELEVQYRNQKSMVNMSLEDERQWGIFIRSFNSRIHQLRSHSDNFTPIKAKLYVGSVPGHLHTMVQDVAFRRFDKYEEFKVYYAQQVFERDQYLSTLTD